MFNFFKKNKKGPENLKGILKFLESVSQELRELKEENKKNLQKIGVVRFNPFSETGGDQSFSIAVLDANNDGFVITSHYHREANRTYAKPVKNRESKYQLSNEEKQAISQAINGS